MGTPTTPLSGRTTSTISRRGSSSKSAGVTLSRKNQVLDKNAQRMQLAVLLKIRDYVNAGAVVVGLKPTESPSNSDDQVEFKRIADELWGSDAGERTVGKGKVFAGV